MSCDVVLVSAPFLSVTRPALGISLLSAALTARGISSQIVYANIDFAREVGPAICETISDRIPTHLLLGEWIFSLAARPGPLRASDLEYLEYVRPLVDGEVLGSVLAMRQHLPGWIERTADRLIDRNPRILGFSTTFQQNMASISIAREVKRRRPDILVCFGGANCEGPMGRALLELVPEIDYVFSGEADRTFPEFVSRVLADLHPRSSDPSVYHRDARLAAPAVAPVSDLDDLPYPDFSDYFAALASAPFKNQVMPGLLFESSRGCWWGAKHHCKFCGLNGGSLRFRSKSPARVAKEIVHLQQRWGIRRIQATDNILDLKLVEPLFDSLSGSRSDLRIFYEVKANLTRDQLRRCAAGGVTWIQPGIESLHDDILKQLDKGVSALQNVALLRDCAEIGIRVLWNLLWGIPGERPEHYDEMARLLPLLEHLDPPNGNGVRIRVDRFSPYFERSPEHGFRDVRPARAYAAVYDADPQVLAELAYFFDGSGEPTCSAEQVHPVQQAIQQWRTRSLETPRPTLLRIRSEGTTAVLDGRRMARSPLRLLSLAEAAVLDAFRRPTFAKRGLSSLETSFAAGELDTAFRALTEHGFIACHGERAVSIVLEGGDRVHGNDALLEYPGGWFEDAGAEARP